MTGGEQHGKPKRTDGKAVGAGHGVVQSNGSASWQ
jgi:hypothetical protein